MTQIMAELGGYCGYSALRFATLQKSLVPNSHYYSFEFSPKYAAIARQVCKSMLLQIH